MDKSKLNPPEPEGVKRIRELEKAIDKKKTMLEEPLLNERRKEFYANSTVKK